VTGFPNHYRLTGIGGRFEIAVQSGALNLTQRWLGHTRISTTAIYASVGGLEETLNGVVTKLLKIMI
jgi:hypothetical protein